VWSATWPKVAAVAIALGIWQLVVWSGWKPEYVLPGPGKVWQELVDQHTKLLDGARQTTERILRGYGVSLVIGVVVGVFVASSKVLRNAFGAFITGLQTMPSVVWVPMAILLFKLSEEAILFIVVLGAAPSIANGVIGGIDQIPPLTLRAGRALGARGLTYYRRIVLPASMPGFVAGLKQGWAFAWRSLMAGELVVQIKGHQSLGTLLQNGKDLPDPPLLFASMVVVLAIGLAADSLVFSRLERGVNRRFGLAR
jgi:NitT/TauT family transport system permease protein